MKTLFLRLAVLILLAAAFLRIWQLHQCPPGPHYDEAANVLIIRSIAFGGANLFPITNSYQGRETLYHYLNVPLFRFVLNDAFTMRIVSMYANLITIAAAMALARMMFRGERGIIIALAVGIMMTLSFHQMFMGRQAFRAVTLPMMQALGMLFLWRGLIWKLDAPPHPQPFSPVDRGEGSHSHGVSKVPSSPAGRGFRGGVKGNNQKMLKWLSLRPAPGWIIWIILGGLFSGGAVYTYMASRLFPVWLGFAALVLLLIDRKNWRVRLPQGILFFSVMLFTMIPLIDFALKNPDLFWQRLGEVNTSENSVTLVESIRAHAEMFFIRGDRANLRYNIPERPYFTYVEGLFLILGIGAALRGMFRAGHPTQRTAYFLVLLAPLMVIPSLVSRGEIPPSHMRSLGMVPLIFLLAGVGVEYILSWVQQRAGLRPAPTHDRSAVDDARLLGMIYHAPTRLIYGLVVGVLLIGTPLAWHTYYGWASRADLFYQTDGDLAAAAKWLHQHVENVEDTPVYIASYHREHPTVLISFEQPVNWLGQDSLFIPPPNHDGIVIYSHDQNPPEEWAEILAPYAVEDLPRGAEGAAFKAYRLNHDVGLPEHQAPVQTISSRLMTYLGMYGQPITSGQVGEMTMMWRIDQNLPYTQLRPILDVVDDASGVVLSTSDSFPLHTDRWRAGEIMIQRMKVNIPDGTPPGRYTLRLTWVDRVTETYISYIGTEGGSGGIYAEIGTIEVIRPRIYPSVDALNIQTPQRIEVTDGVRFLGWNSPKAEVRPGEQIIQTTFWQSTPITEARAVLPLRLFLQSEAGEQTLIWEGTLPHPPEDWVDGELVTAHLPFTIPREQANGDYSLVLEADEQNIVLGGLHINGIPRVMDAPLMQHLVGAFLGDTFMLQGYDLNIENSSVDIGLVWTLEKIAKDDYTVFVHIVDASGIIVAQRDQMPIDNTYPTSLWLPGEYVIDSYNFEEIPPGEYTVRVGLYLQSNGVRLPVRMRDDISILGDYLIIPLIIMQP